LIVGCYHRNQGCRAVIKMTQLRLRSSSFHGSSSDFCSLSWRASIQWKWINSRTPTQN